MRVHTKSCSIWFRTKDGQLNWPSNQRSAQLSSGKEKTALSGEEETVQGEHHVDNSVGNIIANKNIPTNVLTCIYRTELFFFSSILYSCKAQLLYTCKTKIQRLYKTSAFDIYVNIFTKGRINYLNLFQNRRKKLHPASQEIVLSYTCVQGSVFQLCYKINSRDLHVAF